MITKEQLNDYMTENECDIFMDGPFDYSDEQFEIFGNMFLNKIKEKYNIDIVFDEDWYENIWINTENEVDNDEIVDLGMEIMADWANQYNIEFFNY
jgi:hypothetical protein